jgi:hypothetical protein
MATIKKRQLDNSIFNISSFGDDGVEQVDTTPIKVWVDIKVDTFEIKVYRTTDSTDKILLWHKIELAELTKKPGFDSQTVWYVNQFANTVAVKDNEEVVSDIKGYDIVDLFSETITSKPEQLTKQPIPYIIFVPDAHNPAGMNSFLYRINMDSSVQFIIEGPSASDFDDETITIKDMISNITLSSDSTTLSPDSSIVINVTSDPVIKEVYLEQVSGMLNKTRVKLTNGQGSFTLFSTGLDAGETARVKVGHRKFTGVSDFSIIVS